MGLTLGLTLGHLGSYGLSYVLAIIEIDAQSVNQQREDQTQCHQQGDGWEVGPALAAQVVGYHIPGTPQQMPHCHEGIAVAKAPQVHHVQADGLGGEALATLLQPTLRTQVAYIHFLAVGTFMLV